MSRYVNADALIARWNKMSVRGRTEFDQEIMVTPTIDIVRCKECRKVREYGGHANCNGYLYCRKWKTPVDEGGFCSWGKRGSE